MRGMAPRVSQLDWTPVDQAQPGDPAKSGRTVVKYARLKPGATPSRSAPTDEAAPHSALPRFPFRKFSDGEDPFLARSDDDEVAPDLTEPAPRRQVAQVKRQIPVRTASSNAKNVPARTAARSKRTMPELEQESTSPAVVVTANRAPGRIPVSESSQLNENTIEIRPADVAGPSSESEITPEENTGVTRERPPVELLAEPDFSETEVDLNAAAAPAALPDPTPLRTLPRLDSRPNPGESGAPVRHGKTGIDQVRIAGIEHDNERPVPISEWTGGSAPPVLTDDMSGGATAAEADLSGPRLVAPGASGPVLRAPDAADLPATVTAGDPSDSAGEAQHPLAPRPVEHSIMPRLTSASRIGLAIGLAGLFCAGVWRFTEWRRFRNARRR